jgi:hypothetical protein
MSRQLESSSADGEKASSNRFVKAARTKQLYVLNFWCHVVTWSLIDKIWQDVDHVDWLFVTPYNYTFVQ